MTTSTEKLSVYRSSAGSGKTFTLVKHYLKLALSGDRPDYFKHILAITFTNKAASEMKSRVMVALADISSRNDLEGTSKYLFADLLEELPLTAVEIREKASAVHTYMLHNYSDLSIMTIDRFMYRVIRSFSRELGLQLGFEVSINSEELLQETIASLMAKVGEDEELTRFILNFAQRQLDDDKSWKIERGLLAFAKSMLSDRHRKEVESLDDWTPAMFIEVHDRIEQGVGAFEAEVKALGKKFNSILSEQGLSVDDFQYKTTGPGALGKKLEAFSIGEWKDFGSRILTAFDEEGPLCSKNTPEASKLHIDAIRPQLQELWTEVKSTMEALEQWQVAFQIKRQLMSLGLLSTIQRLSNDFKEENNQLYISDFNEKIAEIVENEPMPFIYERVGYRFNHFLIDEFQDTSIIQWFNLLPLVEEGLSKASYSMIVGDGKQSIYRWRAGDAEQFERLPRIEFNGEDLTHKYNLHQHYKPEVLQFNFRSEPSIIHFNNEFFEGFKSEADYASNTYENHAQKTLKEVDQGFVQIAYLEGESVEEWYEEVVEQMVDKIDELRNSGIPLRSMAILVRKKKEVPIISRKLGERNIDFISAESLRVDQSVQVKLMVAALRYISRPDEAINKAELIWRLHENDLLSESVHSVLVGVKELRSQDYPLNTIDLEDIRKKSTLFEIVEVLLRTFELDQSYTGFLNVFIEEVFAYQKQRSSDLHAFLSHWQSKKDNLSISIPEGQEAVQILTVHKSKGLEFDCVFVPSIHNGDARPVEEYSWLDEDAERFDLPTALVKLTKSAGPSLLEAYDQEMDRSRLDELNLMYVAFTRASKRLYSWFRWNDESKKSLKLEDRVRNVLSGMEGWSSEGRLFVRGNEGVHFEVKTESNEVRHLSRIHSSPWEEKLKIAPINRVFGDQGAIDEGVKVHTLLEGLTDINNVDEAIRHGLIHGVIRQDESAVYRKKLDDLMAEPEVRRLFDLDGELLVERELIDERGNSHRPDRLIITGKEALVVDYKTGMESSSHRKQVSRYKDLLHASGFESIRGYLLYLNPVKLVEV